MKANRQLLPEPPTSPLNVLAIVKPNGERYVFMFDDANKKTMLNTIGRFASDPELSFTWFDAALLAQKIRKMEA